jgi:hypothetical protein
MNATPRFHQRGAVLVVGLIMLAVMTLFVVSMLKTSIIELKIGGASQVAALNFSNAETAIDNFIQVNNGRFAPNFLGLSPGAGGPINTPPTVQGGTVTVGAAQINCGPPAVYGTQVKSDFRSVFFELRATATGTLGGTTTIHQGVQTLTTSC